MLEPNEHRYEEYLHNLSKGKLKKELLSQQRVKELVDSLLNQKPKSQKST